MKKLILMSVVFATFAIPIVLARRYHPEKTNSERSLARMRRWFLVFCVVYVLVNLYVAPRL